MLRAIVQSVIQDFATSGGLLLVGDGIMTKDQMTGFVGSAVFLGMLIFNAILQHNQTKGN